jgi:protein O-mannosyl-transferase
MLAGITAHGWGAVLLVAALFALHPINVESVAWIAERKNVLSMFFFLLALAAYGWYARRPELRRYLVVTALYALALMAKPQVITFPFALLLLDYWPLRRMAGAESTGDQWQTRAAPGSFWKLVWEKIPWFALSAASALITMKAQAAAKHEELPLWEHLANAALSYAKYIGKTFWPANLAPLYPHPGRTISVPVAALSAVGLIAITVLVVIFRQRRYLFVGWFWFLGTMVPMIGFVQVGVQSMADRYAYIPLLGIFVIVCWGAADLLGLARAHVSASQTTWSRVAMLASAMVLLALGFALHRQVNFWTNNFTLWRHTLDITKNNFIAEDSAATALLAEGKTDEAMQYFRRAQLVRPTDPVSALNVASYAQQQGNYASAIEQYGRVLELTNSPGLLALVYANRGYALVRASGRMTARSRTSRRP